MKKEIDLKTSFKALSRAISRYGLTLFVILLVSGLSAAVLILNDALQQTGNGDNGLVNQQNQGLDQATIERVNQLNTSSKAKNNFSPPAGRISPFTE